MYGNQAIQHSFITGGSISSLITTYRSWLIDKVMLNVAFSTTIVRILLHLCGDEFVMI